MKGQQFKVQHQDISHLYSQTGHLKAHRIIAFIYRNRLPAGLVRALFALAKALLVRGKPNEN